MYDDAETLRRLEAAMLALDPKIRAIFMARRIEGMSYQAIARRTGLTVRQVERYMAQAIDELDREMEAFEKDDP